VSENDAADRHHFHSALAIIDGHTTNLVSPQSLFPFLEFKLGKVEEVSRSLRPLAKHAIARSGGRRRQSTLHATTRPFLLFR